MTLYMYIILCNTVAFSQPPTVRGGGHMIHTIWSCKLLQWSIMAKNGKRHLLPGEGRGEGIYHL